ncbi:MAG: phage tail sheath subtilisin-like domain-containing protein [Lachnospiraceae bacterium]|nr:phage tail sheath subtilisin-like domain-containing protein [Lachnospiraceae bacterium]
MSGMPSINIKFTELAASAVQRGERGVIAMILKEASVPATNPVVCASLSDIPSTLTADNKKQLELALTGYVNTPKKVIAYIIPATVDNEDDDPVNNTDYTDALNYLKTVQWNYLVIPTVATDQQTATVANYIKTEREGNKLVKAVLPDTLADNEGIINYTTAGVEIDSVTYTAEQFCARIAGIIAGTPLKMSATYAPIPEASDCTRLTKAEMDAAVNAGKFIVWWDGEKVKTARAIDSLTTLTSEKNAQFQKIKIVEAMDMITDDIRKTCEDDYIGKFANTYDNKQLLIGAITGYFDALIIDGVITTYTIGIDVDANRAYLMSKGVDVTEMTDEQIKMANTGSNVYLKGTLGMLDAIEDIDLKINI